MLTALSSYRAMRDWRYASPNFAREPIEVFSLFRFSTLPIDEYIDRYFDTGSECQRDIEARNDED